MFDVNDKLLRGLYEQLPLGVCVEDYSEVKLIADRLRNEGVRDLGLYLSENPDVLFEMVWAIQALHANDSLLEMFRVKSFQEYLSLDDDYEHWKDSGWKEYYLQELVSLADGKTHFGDYSELAADGTPIEIRCVSRILDGHEDDWSLVMSTHEDITERKQIEKALNDSEQRNRNFAADVAHELRTPLAVFRLHLDNLPDSQDRDKLRQEVDGMARLVEQLLALARLDDKSVKISEIVDLHSICVDVAAHLAPIAIREGRSIEVVGSDGPVNVLGMSAALEMTVRNLVENAIKYSNRGTTITIELSDDATVRVIDIGPGIPVAIRETVFDRFIRVDRQISGVGIGLSIVRRVIQAHNGSVEIDDNPEGGTVITISLPSIETPVAAVS